MANIDYDIGHSSAEDLAITIPNTVTRNVLRCDEKADQFAEAVYKTGGYYDKLANAFDKIAQYCSTALNGKGIVSDTIKADLKNAKKKAAIQKNGCKNRKAEIKQQYNITRDIFTMLNKQ